MLDQNDIKKIEQAAKEFFEKTTIAVSKIETKVEANQEEPFAESPAGQTDGASDVVNLSIKLDEPQILIGERGQTLFEIQRLLRMLLTKKLQKVFYLNLDINDYKSKKIEYLRELAKDLADEVALTREEKVLSPMSSYERRAIHIELKSRQDVVAESQGEGLNRHIVIKPK